MDSTRHPSEIEIPHPFGIRGPPRRAPGARPWRGGRGKAVWVVAEWLRRIGVFPLLHGSTGIAIVKVCGSWAAHWRGYPSLLASSLRWHC